MNDHLPLNEEILGLCIDAILDQGKTVDDCVASVPESEEIEPLLRLSGRLQAAARLAAPIDFRLAARTRLENRLDEHHQILRIHSPERRPFAFQHGDQESQNSRLVSRTRTERLPAGRSRSVYVYAAGLALIFIMLLASTTTGYASRSIPGELLYPVKIASEQVQLAIAPAGIDNADLHSRFAEERFQEMKTLIEQEKITHLNSTVSSYQEEIEHITDAYFKSEKISKQDKVKVLNHLATQLADHDAQLTTLIANLPKDHPDISVETALRIQNETKLATDFTIQVFIALRDDIRNNKELLEDLKEFHSLVTVIAPDQPGMTSTPAPSATWATQKPTHTRSATLEEGKSELPTSVTTVRPTPWVTDWATLIPDFTITSSVDWFITNVPTYLPTYLPTLLPTYFPPSDPGDDGGGDTGEDEEFPGWDWPDDFPDDSGDGDEPPGWEWP